MSKLKVILEKKLDILDYDKLEFPYFPSKIETNKALGKVSLSKFLNSHKNPKSEIIEVFKEIEEAAEVGDLKLKDKLKQENLFYFTPSVRLNIRKYSEIKSFTGVMVTEFDKMSLRSAKKLKSVIFNDFESCICAYLSPSKKGVKFLFKIPVVNSVEEYKEYYHGISIFMEDYGNYDPSNQNCVLPLFLSYDTEMLIRKPENVKTWVLKGLKEDSFPVEPIKNFKPVNKVFDWQVRRVKSIIEKLVKKADLEGVGHTNVRSAALIAGGYCAGGYLTEFDAWSFLENEIKSSTYLQKNVNGYLRTAKQMFNKGQSAPLKL